LETIDIIIGLLDIGKTLSNAQKSVKLHSDNHKSIQKIISLVNQLTGYERSQVIMDYIEGRVDLRNTILRLVVDERKKPLPQINDAIVLYSDKRKNEYSSRNKIGRRRLRYNKDICINLLRELYIQHGHPLSRKDYIRYSQEREDLPCYITLMKHICGGYASWDEVLCEAGLKIGHNFLSK